MGLECIEGGGFRRLCRAAFNRNQLDDCIDCWLQHGCAALQAKLRERLFQLLRSRGSVDCGCGKVKFVQLVEAEKEDGYVVDRLSMLRRVKRQL